MFGRPALIHGSDNLQDLKSLQDVLNALCIANLLLKLRGGIVAKEDQEIFISL